MKIKTIAGGVCAAKGFRAAGVPAEIKYKGADFDAFVEALTAARRRSASRRTPGARPRRRVRPT